MLRRFQTLLVPILFVTALQPSFRAAGADDLKPALAKLSADEPDARISGIRDLLRRKAPADLVRPYLEKLLGDTVPTVRIEVVWAVHELLGEKGSDLLEKLYADPDHTVRDSAVRAACRLWDKSRPKELCKAAFGDPDFAVKVEVLNTLREYFPHDNDAVVLFRSGLKDASEGVQRSAVFGVQAARDGKAVEDLGLLAKKANDIVAVPAVDEALATIGNADAVRVLIGLLPKPPQGQTKPSSNVRAAATRALGRIKAKEAAPALRELLKDPEIIVRLGTIDALIEVDDRFSASAIAEQLKHQEPRIRRTALRGLRRFKDVSTAPAVIAVLNGDKDTTVRAGSVTCLADILGEKAIPELAKLRTDLEPSVRLEAAGALAGIGKPAVSALLPFLKDADPSVQVMAVEGIGQVGGPDHTAVLGELLDMPVTKSKVLRATIVTALGALSSPNAMPWLEKLTTDDDPGIRQRVAAALGQIGGTKAKELLDGLNKDKISAVRLAAQRALDSLAKGGAGQTPAPKSGKGRSPGTRR